MEWTTMHCPNQQNNLHDHMRFDRSRSSMLFINEFSPLSGPEQEQIFDFVIHLVLSQTSP
jgi:hypothetical protein